MTLLKNFLTRNRMNSLVIKLGAILLLLILSMIYSFGSYKKMPTKNNKKNILSVSIPGQIGCVEDSVNKQYSIAMPSGTSLKTLAPIFNLSQGATITPASGRVVDFSKDSVTYTVTAENGAALVWTIHVGFTLPLITADNSNIQYTGRIDFESPTKPKFSAPGVYIKAKFTGTFCDIDMFDATSYNYIEVIIDDQTPVRMFMQSGRKTYRVASDLSKGEHTILICKDTEAAVGSLTFFGFKCEGLSELPDKSSKKLECYGNSITCGAKMITDLCSQGTGSNWNITNKAYMSFGAIAARDMNAQWMLTSVSGIGLIHSCCGMTYTLPDAYDRLYLDNSSSPKWDFTKYTPDVVTIELGTNDGVQDSTTFCNTYVSFIQAIRVHYPNAHIFLLTGPSTAADVFNFLVNSLTRVVNYMNNTLGDSKVHKIILSSHSLNGGCDGHPNEAQQQQIATDIENVIKPIMGW
jgi:lysophospholipase L1-like esterase